MLVIGGVIVGAMLTELFLEWRFRREMKRKYPQWR